MKTNIYFFFIAIALLAVCCDESDDGFRTDNKPDDLVGNVVYQKTTVRTLHVAEVNSVYKSTMYGYASSYTRPVWSADGLKFAAVDLISSVETDSSSVFAIKIVDIVNGTITRWVIGSSIYIYLTGPLTWSPDGNTIAFLANPYNKIIYLNTQTGDTIQTRVSLEINRGITALAWNPDGNIAVNVSYTSNFQRENEIWMLEPFKTALKNKISSIPELYSFEHLDWNNKGSELLLSTSIFHNKIYVLATNTGECAEVPNIRGLASCWSPDGKYIMYTGVSGYSGFTIIPGLFVSNVKGSFETLLISSAGYSDWH